MTGLGVGVLAVDSPATIATIMGLVAFGGNSQLHYHFL